MTSWAAQAWARWLLYRDHAEPGPIYATECTTCGDESPIAYDADQAGL